MIINEHTNIELALTDHKGPGWTSTSTYYGICHQFPHRKCAKLLKHELYDNINIEYIEYPH